MLRGSRRTQPSPRRWSSPSEPYEACNVKIGSALGLRRASLRLALAQAAQGKIGPRRLQPPWNSAIVANTAMGSSLWTATARRDLAEVLRLRGHAGDVARDRGEHALAITVGAILDAERLVDNHPRPASRDSS